MLNLNELSLDRTNRLWGIGALVGATTITFFIVPRDQWTQTSILSVALIWASLIDKERMILPDLFTLGLILIGLAFSLQESQKVTFDRAIGAAVGYTTLAVVAFAYRRWRGIDGLGGGDAKLFAAAGAWLGWMYLPIVMLIASLTATVWLLVSAIFGKKRGPTQAFPFGPFIALGFWVIWVQEAAR